MNIEIEGFYFNNFSVTEIKTKIPIINILNLWFYEQNNYSNTSYYAQILIDSSYSNFFIKESVITISITENMYDKINDIKETREEVNNAIFVLEL